MMVVVSAFAIDGAAMAIAPSAAKMYPNFLIAVLLGCAGIKPRSEGNVPPEPEENSEQLFSEELTRGSVALLTSPRLRGEVGLHRRCNPGEGDSPRVRMRGESPPNPLPVKNGERETQSSTFQRASFHDRLI